MADYKQGAGQWQEKWTDEYLGFAISHGGWKVEGQLNHWLALSSWA